MSNFRIKANKKDFYRSLLTDTLPRETPIIFSNDGFYKNIKSYLEKSNQFHFEIVGNMLEFKEDTRPYVYKINKDPSSYRALSLIHPGSQVNYAKFYEKYSNSITYYSKKSKTSIRAPVKVANSFYIKGFTPTLNNYRSDKIDTVSGELLDKYSNSYFSYKGYKKKHEFFNSLEYLIQKKILLVDDAGYK